MDINDLFSYRPDPKAVAKRMMREALTLYEWGTDGKVHQPVYTSYDGLLKKFYLYPTFDCPLRCPFCYADGGVRKTEEFDAGKLFSITQEAIDAGYKSIVVVGGEPLYYYDIDRLLDLYRGLNRGKSRLILRTAFSFPLSEEKLNLISDVFDEITVSIDGDEKTHDANRGKGIYAIAMSNLLYCLNTGRCKISICSVMSRADFDGVPGKSVRDFCNEHGIEKLVVQSPVPMGRAKKSISMQEPRLEWRKDEEWSLSYVPNFSCGLGKSIYMEPDGKLYPCYALCGKEHYLGNLAEESLADVLGRGKLLTYINTGVDTNKRCKNCEVRYICGGKCHMLIEDNSDVNTGEFICTQKDSILQDLEEARKQLKKLESEE